MPNYYPRCVTILSLTPYKLTKVILPSKYTLFMHLNHISKHFNFPLKISQGDQCTTNCCQN